MSCLLNPPGKLKLVSLLILTALSSNSFAEDDYSFSDSFIRGQHTKSDFSKYASVGITEGVYSLDVFTNGEWRGRYDLKAAKQPDGNIGICYDKAMLSKFGLSVKRLNESLAKDDSFCGTLKAWKNDKDIHEAINKGALRLDITVPQIYQDQQYRGYVDPSMWDTGIPAMNIGWNANVWNSHYSANNSSDSTTGYIGVNATASLGGWALKHTGNLSWSDKNSAKWNSSKTYLQRPISQMNSLLSVGQISGTGEFFDSVTVRGVNLKTNDAMYPDGMTTFAPEVRGEARTNALVTIRQDGNVIHQVTVSPGPFVISDIYPSGYGSSLEVSVKEADGTVTYFTVPYNSVNRLLRPGRFRYELTAGKPDNGYFHEKPIIYQGTAQYGFNNLLTGYVGVSGFDDYKSFLAGTGINTPIGGFSVDATSADFKKKNTTDKGKMYRASYSRSFEETNTSVSVTASKRSDKGFYTTSEALRYDGSWERASEKSDVTLLLNQKLPDSWGSLYVNSRLVEYWDGVKRDKQYQIGYSNRLGHLFYTVSAQKTRYSNGGHSQSDNRFSLNFSLPLNFEGHSTSSLTSNTVINNSRYSNTQVGVNGSIGDQHEITYGVNTSVGDNKYVSLNGGYKSTWSSLNSSYSQGSGYRQVSAGGSGTIVAHSEGVTLSPETGDTLALVKAEGAKGASIGSSLGSKIDSNGFAIVSTLRPYRVNTVEIDPKGAPDNVYFSETMKQAVPYQGSVVKLTFDTEVQDNLMFKGKLKNGRPLPFGANVYNEQGIEIGTVSQGGNVFIRNASQAKAHIQLDGGTCTFILPKQDGEVICN